jgi:hypothetical protein
MELPARPERKMHALHGLQRHHRYKAHFLRPVPSGQKGQVQGHAQGGRHVHELSTAASGLLQDEVQLQKPPALAGGHVQPVHPARHQRFEAALQVTGLF